MRKVAVILVAGLAVLGLASCGGSDGGTRVDKIAKQLQDEGMDPGPSECAAKALVDADFTDAEIAKLQKDGKGVSEAKVKKFTSAMMGCVGAG